MYLGVDLGTSALKLVLVDDEQRIVGDVSAPLSIARPRPRWSEQDPAAWWDALGSAVRQLRREHGRDVAAIRAIGLAGQMHGAVLLDDRDAVLRPCILWNDGRSAAECAELERREPLSRQITGNLAMPGFTAPKLLWVARHEPEIFAAMRRVLLPKDYLRLRMTGVAATDMSDAAGTCWLDVRSRIWSDRMLAASGLAAGAMPQLFEGSAVTATLLPAIADAWGLSRTVVVAAGAGDNAAAAVGVGAVEPGDGLVSIGTSGVIFQVDDMFRPAPERAVHAFCHCLPARWHRMAVTLSAASCLSWLKEATGAPDEATLAAEAEQAQRVDELMFLPYLAGERTPHNDPAATGAFVGLSHRTRRGELARAVMEGVALAFADGAAAMGLNAAAGQALHVVGGGVVSPLWMTMIASALGRPLSVAGTAHGPAFGAARLARLAAADEASGEVCIGPSNPIIVEPDPRMAAAFVGRLRAFRELYRSLRKHAEG